MTNSDPLAIDEIRLRHVVENSTGCPILGQLSWQVEPIDHLRINLMTTGLYRISGDGSKYVLWSVILKIVALKPPDPDSPFNSSDDPAHWNYWKRESLAYQSSWLSQQGCSLAVPRCLAVDDSHPNEIWMWLEDIPGTLASVWPLERYELAARHLGQYQGAYLMGRPLPQETWLVRDYLRARFTAPPPKALDDHVRWSHPLVAQFFPQPFYQLLSRLWDAREAVLDRIANAPQTVCHMDIWPPNLIARNSANRGSETVLIDWSGVGIGAIGQDLGNLVPDSTTRFFVAGEDLPRLENLVLQGYIAGLRDAGWTGDPEIIHEIYNASAALTWGFFGCWTILAASDESRRLAMEKRFNLPFAEIIRRRAPAISHILMTVERTLNLVKG